MKHGRCFIVKPSEQRFESASLEWCYNYFISCHNSQTCSVLRGFTEDRIAVVVVGYKHIVYSPYKRNGEAAGEVTKYFSRNRFTRGKKIVYSENFAVVVGSGWDQD